TKYNSIFAIYSERSQNFNHMMNGKSTPRHCWYQIILMNIVTIVSTKFGALPVAFASLVATAIQGGLLASATSDLDSAEERLSEKRKAFGETQFKLAHLDGELKTWETAKNKLVRHI